MEGAPTTALANARYPSSAHRRIQNVKDTGTVEIAARLTREDETIARRSWIPLLEQTLGLRREIDRPWLAALRSLLADAGSVGARDENLRLEEIYIAPAQR